MSEPHLDHDALEELKDVMAEDFPILITTYLDDSVVRISSLKEAIATSNSEAIRKEAHSFKGSSGNIGAPKLAELCRQLESMAKEGNIDKAQPVYEELVIEYDFVKSQMQSIM